MYVICGNFANNNTSIVNGQVTKTRNFAKLLKKTKEKIKTIDTSKNKLLVFFEIISAFFKCDVFFLCVSRNGTKRLTPLISFCKKIRKKTRIIFLCVGTCPLPKDYYPGKQLTKKEMSIGKKLSVFDIVCPETEIMKTELQNVFGLHNVCVFKNVQIGKRIMPKKSTSLPENKFVYFSRISLEKNIVELFEAIDKLDSNCKLQYSIDFYGPIDDDARSFFDDQIRKRKNINYKGILDNEKAIEILNGYKALIFTTKCLEGTPGAIIDSAFANLPVVSQPFWASNELIIEPNIGTVNSDIYDNILNFLKMDHKEIDAFKNNCYSFAVLYSEQDAIERLKSLINN